LPSRIQRGFEPTAPATRPTPRAGAMRASWCACRSVCVGLSNVGHYVVPGQTVEVDWWLASVVSAPYTAMQILRYHATLDGIVQVLYGTITQLALLVTRVGPAAGYFLRKAPEPSPDVLASTSSTCLSLPSRTACGCTLQPPRTRRPPSRRLSSMRAYPPSLRPHR
jgi:hypothetical protein